MRKLQKCFYCQSKFVLILLLFLIFGSTLTFGQPLLRDDRAWFDRFDPAGEKNPLFYSDYGSELSPTDKDVLVFTDIATYPAGPAGKGSIMIIVNADLYTDSTIVSSVNAYATQLANEGYEITIHTSRGGFEKRSDNNGLTALRREINLVYNESGLNGCIFIGRLPTAWFQFNSDFSRVYIPDPGDSEEDVNYVEFPCDLFFMDLNGIWNDNFGYVNKKTDPDDSGPSDNIFDEHLGNREPEIWIARISTNTLTSGTEAQLINSYINQKNLLGRNDSTLTDFGALSYEDNGDALHSTDLLTTGDGLALVYGENIEIATPPGTNRNAFFTNLLNTTKYEWIHIGIRSSSPYHHFGDNKSVGDDIIQSPSLSISCKGPKILDSIGSSVNRFIEDDYMGGKYLFDINNTILAVIGSTKSGGLTNYTESMCSHFAVGCIGDGFREWMKTIINQMTTDADRIRIAYGMTLLGDPTIEQIAENGVEQSIIKGVNFLLKDGEQQSNGSWSNDPSVTAFSALALINSGYYYDSDLVGTQKPSTFIGSWAVSQAINYLLTQMSAPVARTDDKYGNLTMSWIATNQRRTYYTASTILPLAAAARNTTIDPADRDVLVAAIEILRNFLIFGQMDGTCAQTMTSSTWEGGFGYITALARPDNSNTQFGIMGIRVANDTLRVLGTGMDLNLWDDPDSDPTNGTNGTFDTCVDKWLENTRHSSGAHGYAGSSPYQPMTAAALWTYAMCGYPSGGPEIKESNYQPTAADQLRSQHAHDALSSIGGYLNDYGSFNIFTSGGYNYYTYTLAKALAMNRQDQLIIADIPWYEKMCDYLIEGKDFSGNVITTGQEADGSWPGPVHSIISSTAARQMNTAWNINTLRINKLPGSSAPTDAPEDFLLAFLLTITLESHSDLHVYDNEGRHVGKKKLTYIEIVNFEEVERTIYFTEQQVPGSSYKLYKKEADGSLSDRVLLDEFPDGVIPESSIKYPNGIAQVITIKNAQPDSLRVEMQGTSTGTFDLDVKLSQGEKVIKEIGYNDRQIQEEQVNHCYTKLVNIEGMEMFNEQLEESAVTWIDESMIRELVEPGTPPPAEPTPTPISFEIKNLAPDTEMKNVSVSCTNIQGANGVIIDAFEHMDFDYNTTIPENSSILVQLTINVPEDFVGPGDGEITVTSSNARTKTRKIRILTNKAPNAVAGDDQFHYAGAATNFEVIVLLDGSGSEDEDGEITSFRWFYSSQSGILLAEGETAEIPLGLGFHRVFLCVEDDGGEKSWDNLVIEIANRAPTAVAGDDISVFGGAYGIPEANVILDGTASTDPENDPLTYKWYEGETLIAEGPTPEVKLAAGIHTISLVVDDTVNFSEPDEIIVTVTEAVPATMWLWPNKIMLKGSWGLLHTSINLPKGIKREDIDDSVNIQLYTADGDYIESYYDMIFPPSNTWQKHKNFKKWYKDEKSRCNIDKIEKVKIMSVFFKTHVANLLEEEGEYIVYAVGKLKSGEYFNASAKIIAFKPYHHHHHNNNDWKKDKYKKKSK